MHASELRAAGMTRKDGTGLVAYIALPKVKDGPLRAKLWVDDEPRRTALELTESGNSALSVELLPYGDQALALSLEARMGGDRAARTRPRA